MAKGHNCSQHNLADLQPAGDLSNLIYISEAVKMPTENHVCLSCPSLASSFIVYTEEYKNGRGFPNSCCHSGFP